MVDEATLNQAKADVDASIEIWRKLIGEKLGDVVDFAYVKGSTLRKWESPLDYVPLISDVDIHVKTMAGRPLFTPDPEGFIAALGLTRLYEEMFKERRPEHLHIPRPQIVTMDELEPGWVPHDPSSIVVLHGEVKPGVRRPDDEVRADDLAQLLELEHLLPALPMRVVNRIGLEYYRIIRQLCWWVSPTPVRLLSQMVDPDHVWGLNRTQVAELLDDYGFDDVSKHYRDYYMAGWDSFETRFQEDEAMRKTIEEAYWVLHKSWVHAQTLKNG